MRDIVVVGASAGGVEALQTLVQSLPGDLPAAVFVVLHVASGFRSALHEILGRASVLPVVAAREGQAIRRGVVYVARPDFHLLFQDGSVRLGHGPRENGHRPAIDALFRSAASVFGPRAIAVVLSGALDDGTAGIAEIKERGGVALVQDPEDAMVGDMPRSAIENTAVDEVLPVAELGAAIRRLTHGGPAESPRDGAVRATLATVEAMDKELREEAEMQPSEQGSLAALACPECSGALWEIQNGKVLRFACHVGHSYSIDSLEEHKSEEVEQALWAALRALKERAGVSRRLAERARRRGHEGSAERYETRAAEADDCATLIHQALLAPPQLAVEEVELAARPPREGRGG